MELDNIKSDWKNTGEGRRNQAELLNMTKIENHPNILRIRLKFMIEAVLLMLFLAFFYEVFDGATKPIWANAFLIVTSTAYIVVRFLGWIALRTPIKGSDLKKSLVSFQIKLKKMTVLILSTSFLFGSSIISFFSSSIDFTQEKYFVLTGMILTLLFLVYLSIQNLVNRIKGINATILEFENGDN